MADWQSLFLGSWGNIIFFKVSKLKTKTLICENQNLKKFVYIPGKKKKELRYFVLGGLMLTLPLLVSCLYGLWVFVVIVANKKFLPKEIKKQMTTRL